MPWPGITDFSDAIQQPGLCFAGTELEDATVAVSGRGMPLVYSGAFACVYSVSVGSQSFAVRCFTREVRDQQERYHELSDYLLDVLPPSFVHFEYAASGIRLRGEWYPVVKMEWVDGKILSGFVESNLGDPNALRRLAAQWRGGPAASLRGLRIAHNDLQHGNVMVQDDGSIRLVDYDGIFLPGFAGSTSPELGHRNYQHPKRTADDYGEYVDNFPVLVIYLSLLAIAADAGAWEFFDEDNLIFTRKDFADPKGSDVFRRLRGSPDPGVAELTARLESYCALPVAEVPDLETALAGVPRSPTPSALAPAPPPQKSGSAAPQQQQSAPVTQPVTGGPAQSTPPAAPAPAAARTSGATLRIPAGRPVRPAAMAAASRRRRVRGIGSSAASAGRSLLSAARSGELALVALGVLATVAAVTAGTFGAVAWAVSQRGW